MVDKPVLVSSNQSLIDTLTAGGRLLLVVLSTAPAAALLIRKGDLIALYDYFHTEQGTALLAAIAGLISIGYGLYKSYVRGKQLTVVASSTKVPAEVADIK
jgi:hypothetical protein